MDKKEKPGISRLYAIEIVGFNPNNQEWILEDKSWWYRDRYWRRNWNRDNDVITVEIDGSTVYVKDVFGNVNIEDKLKICKGFVEKRTKKYRLD